MYRKQEKLSLGKSLYCFFKYVLNAVLKRIGGMKQISKELWRKRTQEGEPLENMDWNKFEDELSQRTENLTTILYWLLGVWLL